VAAVPLLELTNVSKWFGATRALSGVSFDVVPGEVHVLAGENGAGKSTLIKILSGVYADYDGKMRVSGVARRFRGPQDAASAGIATIHQELSLIGAMSVTDNLLLGQKGRPYDIVDHRRRRDAARKILEGLAIDVDPDCAVELLPLGTRQLLEVSRALALDARVIVMDEPTSALSESECERLFERMAELLRRGAGIVYISHRLEEIYRLGQRITVLRDGKKVVTAERDALPRRELVSAMTGVELADRAAREPTICDGALLGVDGLRVDDPQRPGRAIVSGVSFELRRGEVLGIAGLQGSGSSELLHGAFGSIPSSGGSVILDGRPIHPLSPARAIGRGLMLLGSDRETSLVRDLGVSANMTLSNLRGFSRAGFLDQRRERAAAREMAQRLAVNARSLNAPVGQLSGGNQQKVALGRCLIARPRVLLLDDPTRGIDVGARAQVHSVIDELAGDGLGVVLVASELEELLSLCDRILVLHRGTVALERARGQYSRERILHAAMGGERAAS
jgi:ABC-type sugar transport system ATPase subunit